ncbi:hypothetical protein O181_099579 [Austropuccinia psidii MF-1]|uniref:Uncharacterized protein n=1 Tax=Austropuccinia psidii MF-1 TaxID=1389203 RepID=A0A9Q3PFK9_9BASI|nr:hypothetical protein [Austropuccinia psidii MF-1]
MSSRLTELTESSLSAPPPSVLHGSGILTQLSLPSMAFSGHFDPSQIYDSYKAVEVLDPACTESMPPYWEASFQHQEVFMDSRNGPFGKEFPVSVAPDLDGTSGYSALTGSRQRDVSRWTNVGGPIIVGGRPIYSSSEVPISRINTKGIVKRIRQIAKSPPDPDSEGSDELYGEEVEVIPILMVNHPMIPLPILLPRDSKAKSSPVPPETSNPLLLQFLLPFLLLHHTNPTPGMP